jgi:uncharacterized membrane protein YjjP (DUF1212 family)
MSVDEGLNKLRDIAAAPSFSLPLRVLGAALVGAFMCPYYGGGVFEMLISAGAACVGYLVYVGVSRFKVAGFIRVFISCLGCTMVVLALSGFFPWHNTTAMIISAVTIFMPGVAITNAARDLLSGDMIAGVARATDAAITAIAISGGAGAIAGIWIWNGGALSGRQAEFPLALFPVFGFLMTIGFCLQMNAPRRQMIVSSLIGGVGMFVLIGGPRIGQGALLTCFVGTCVIATLAEIASRAGRDATTVFIIPGIIPFVPGLGLFESTSAILASNIMLGIGKAATTMITAGSIAIALIVVATTARLIMELARRFEHEDAAP